MPPRNYSSSILPLTILVLPPAPPTTHSPEQVAHSIRERWAEVAFSGWGNSSYENIDHNAYYVWASFNWWMVPWYHLVGEYESSDSGTNSSSRSS